MPALLQCLIIYLAVCALLTFVCKRMFKVIPWPGYLLTALPMAAVVCYMQGYMTAFYVIAIINCITMIPYTFMTIADIRAWLPAVAEAVFTLIWTFRIPAESLSQKILLGISLLCVFFAANGDFINCGIRYDLEHLH